MFYFKYVINRGIRATSAKKQQRLQNLDKPIAPKIVKIQEMRMQSGKQTTKLFLSDLRHRKKIDSLSNHVLFLLSPNLLQACRVTSTLSIMPLILMRSEFMTRKIFSLRARITVIVVFVLVWTLPDPDDFVRCGDPDFGVGLGAD